MRFLPTQSFHFSLKVYVVEIHEGSYCTTFSISRFVLAFELRLSECILEESSSPGVEVLVFSLVVGI